jgi:hypothetical protein
MSRITPPYYVSDKNAFCKALNSVWQKDSEVEVNSKGKIVFIPPHCSRKKFVQKALETQLDAGAKFTDVDPDLCAMLGRKFKIERSGVNMGKGYCLPAGVGSGSSSRRRRRRSGSRKSSSRKASSRKSRKHSSKKHSSKKSRKHSSKKHSKKSSKSRKSRKSRKSSK